jgi:hypothetical protein
VETGVEGEDHLILLARVDGAHVVERARQHVGGDRHRIGQARGGINDGPRQDTVVCVRRRVEIDVFAVEPAREDHPFFQLDNVVLSPHLDDAVLDRARDDFAGFDRSFQVGAIHLYIQRVGHGWSAARTFELQEA